METELRDVKDRLQDNDMLAVRCKNFAEGAKRAYDKGPGDMWLFELYHHLNDCAAALQEDLEDSGYWIGGPYGIRIITGHRLCEECHEPIKNGDYYTYRTRRWWQFWKFSGMIHVDCADR